MVRGGLPYFVAFMEVKHFIGTISRLNGFLVKVIFSLIIVGKSCCSFMVRYRGLICAFIVQKIIISFLVKIKFIFFI
ncbi:MAG: hypothetical protein B7Y07_05585 [Halothiobacillus sp. 24-54-40]|nr:MAG: hypothetical protein B7X12_06095 [Halothiobacillus sp. 20-53-49]OYY36276.1 MAG: hypothetical protein B7Y58_06875 [Halothiobacillus sp. 35-54-62]OYZ87055.1 MAG: hypothetical protein B7Y07_05585 [Halothiobacillus sp. 24-54-40]OZA80623.1 MAG: hypothetical protein B7X64_05250 [Halothiobacillus sp. 39-53-45]